jgi:hypothetical protein
MKPRWKVTYRTQHPMVGSKSVVELVPGISLQFRIIHPISPFLNEVNALGNRVLRRQWYLF